MKKNNLIMAVALLTIFLSSCKKDYTCTGTVYGETTEFNCENCTKKEMEKYKEEITSKGYTDVACKK